MLPVESLQDWFVIVAVFLALRGLRLGMHELLRLPRRLLSLPACSRSTTQRETTY